MLTNNISAWVLQIYLVHLKWSSQTLEAWSTGHGEALRPLPCKTLIPQKSPSDAPQVGSMQLCSRPNNVGPLFLAICFRLSLTLLTLHLIIFESEHLETKEQCTVFKK